MFASRNLVIIVGLVGSIHTAIADEAADIYDCEFVKALYLTDQGYMPDDRDTKVYASQHIMIDKISGVALGPIPLFTRSSRLIGLVIVHHSYLSAPRCAHGNTPWSPVATAAEGAMRSRPIAFYLTPRITAHSRPRLVSIS